MVGGMTGVAVSTSSISSGGQANMPRRYLAYTAHLSRKHTLKQVYDFLSLKLRISREDLRLWKLSEEFMTVLEEEEKSMEELEIEDNQQILIEVRNKDLTWPEEMSQLAKMKSVFERKHQVPTDPGATGLNNLGNTCFMNSALQCVSNTRILTLFFTGGMHLFELNRTNPLGMKGHIAQRYGDLVRELWSGTAKTLAPLKFRWTISKYAPRFNGFQQHDSQELLAFLLDGLHEDLNRVHDKRYVEVNDSDGRPDSVVAKEAWDNHLIRNRSVIVDLFHGQLKSRVRCLHCGHTSVRFDPFTYLSLPLPMDSRQHAEVVVMRLSGEAPARHGVQLEPDDRCAQLRQALRRRLTVCDGTRLLLAEVTGAQIKCFPGDDQKVKVTSGSTLYAYELPDSTARVTAGSAPICRLNDSSDEQQISATCRSDSINNNKPGCGALPNGHIPSGGNHGNMCGEPAVGVTVTDSAADSRPVSVSDARQSSPSSLFHSPVSTLSRNTSALSIGTVNGNTQEEFDGFVVAYHRKMIPVDVYFLSSQKNRPSLFSTPLILPCSEVTTHQDLYVHCWTQISRLVSPLPPSESNSSSNHATDCDDSSLVCEYPFTLKVVQKDGLTCSLCPWFRFCRGCKLKCNEERFNFTSSYIAIEWEPTALHLRFQASSDKDYEDHSSVEECRRKQTEPINLDACLKAFTKEEQLGQDELWYCSKCKKHRLAAKKLEIWRLPPILIIHLKRFQFLTNRWIKSQKIVDFPIRDFDPTSYLAEESCTKIRTCSLSQPVNHNDNHSTAHSANRDEGIAESQKLGVSPAGARPAASLTSSQDDVFLSDSPKAPNHLEKVTQSSIRKESDSVSVESHKCPYDEDYTEARYDLYSMSCHTGILGGGHYVSYCKNPNNKWYCYNDSSCKETSYDTLDRTNAYILFYERRDLDYTNFMPDVRGRHPDTSEIEDECESDMKKMCSIQ